MNWLNAFKAALITQNTAQLQKLIDTMPQFSSLEEMQEALYLTKAAQTLFKSLKNETLTQLQMVKKNIDFLESTASMRKNTLDVTY